ncbi:Integrase, catalytic core [Gossypium australe]|uniref:Integrase, catalytic core n=1 Tax=Gossypium australe TaxID=47621 RepID=A0A5B6UKZ2_9ROSI|nr:Integrase, catalytic core [Gossypium australe]
MEALLKEYMAKNNVVIQSQVASLRTLKNQVGQIANVLNLIPQGALPSDIENSISQGKECCKALTLRSGTQLPQVVNDAITHKDSSDLTHRNNSNPFVEQFTTDRTNQNKVRRLGEFESTALTEGCTVMLMNKLPPKLKDLGSFTILFSNHYVDENEEFHVIGFIEIAVEVEFAKFYHKNSDNDDTDPFKLNEANMTKELGEFMETKRLEDRLGNSFKYLDLSTRSFKPPRPSIEEPPTLELKSLPFHLKYAYLGNNNTLPVVISAELTPDQETKLLDVMRRSKKALGWTIAGIKGINPATCMYKILLEDFHSNPI